MAIITSRFPLAANAETGIEVDPRGTGPDKVRVLGALGFNRLSIGVQDFDPHVQKAVNRLQSFEITQLTIEAARKAGFSRNLDLIYGLPHQTRATFAATLDKVLVLSPERIALYHYAHLPERFKPQRRIDVAASPAPQEKLHIMLDAITRLTGAGYSTSAWITLRNQRRSARAHSKVACIAIFRATARAWIAIVGLGVSAISKIGPTYAQNVRELPEYYDRVNNGLGATARGLQLDRDDLVRRSVIMALMCHFEVSKEAIETAHLIKFDEYFRRELSCDDAASRSGAGRGHVRNGSP